MAEVHVSEYEDCGDGMKCIFRKSIKKKKLEKIIHKYLGIGGRMISWSKSTYRKNHPNNRVYFNAQIFDKNYKFMWAGDLDITKDKRLLKKIQKESNEIFYIIPEPFYAVTKKDFENEWTVKID